MRLYLLALLMISNISIQAQRYLFYLHGKIVEDQGAHAFDSINGYGAYQYEDIVNAFRTRGFTVMSEVRSPNTDAAGYAHKIVQQVDSILSTGVAPADITIIGASKGAIIAMLVSSYLKNPAVNFVLLAGCMQGLKSAFPDIHFCGNILSVYEESDDIGRSCSAFKNSTTHSIPHYKEIILHTGLKHGFLYKPLAVWIDPAIQWANNDYR